jgi:uncharacterized protein YrrD
MQGEIIVQFKENAEVVTSDGQKVGKIDRVVFDPKSNELTHLVVQKGFLFTEDKVVPLNFVESAIEERVVLKEGQLDLDEFPNFEEAHYVPVEEAGGSEQRAHDGLDRLAWYYPVPGSAWWRQRSLANPGISKPPYVRKTEVNIPEGTVALEEGAKVVSSEGEHVGNIERVYADEEEQRVTHLLISKGLISKSRKLIPSMWVDSVREDEVRLSISERFVEKLP